MADQTATFRAIADFSSITAQSKIASASLLGLQKTATGFGTGFQGAMKTGLAGMSSFGSKVAGVGKSMTLGLTLPLGLIGGYAVKTFADFDTAIRKTAANAGATGKEFDALRDKALEMGAKTVFSATEAAEAMFELTAAGLSSTEAMTAIDGVMLLASASGASLATSAALVAQSMNAFGLEADQAGKVADIFTEAANNSALTVEDLGLAMAHAGVLGSTANQQLTSVVAVLEAMVNQGVPAAQAGTALRQAFDNLRAPLPEARDLMEQLGIEVRKANGQMKQAPDVIREIQDSLNDSNPAFVQWAQSQGLSGQAAKDAALQTLFGVEAMTAMGLSMNAVKTFSIQNRAEMKSLARVTKVMGQAWVDAHKQGDQFVFSGADAIQVLKVLGDTSEGTAERFDKAMQKSLGRRLEAVRGSIETLIIRIVDALAPAMKDLARFIERAANKLGEFAKHHPEITQIAVAIALVAAAAGPLAFVFGKMVEGIASVGKALLFLVTNPWIALVVGIGVAFYLAYTKIKPFREAVDGVVDALEKVGEVLLSGDIGGAIEELERQFEKAGTGAQILMVVLGVIAGLFLASISPFLLLGVVIGALVARFDDVKKALLDVWHAIEDGLGEVRDFIVTQWADIERWIDRHTEQIQRIVENGWKVIQWLFQAGVDAVMFIVEAFVAAAIWLWENFGTHVFDAIMNLWEFIRELTQAGLDVILGIIDFFLAIFTGDWEGAWNAIKSIVEGVWNGIMAVINYVINAIVIVIQQALSIIQIIWDAVWWAIKFVAETVWNAILLVINTVIGLITLVIETALTIIQTIWDLIWNAIKTTAEFIWAGIQFAIETAINAVKSVVEAVLNTISFIWNNVWNGIKAATDTIMGLLSGAVQLGMDGIKAVIDGALWVFAQAWDGIKAVFKDPIQAVIDLTINPFIHAVNTVSDALGFGLGIGDVKLHSGGVVGQDESGGPGFRSLKPNEQYALLEQGEGVIPVSSMSRLGPQRFEQIRRGSVPKFHEGGVLGGQDAWAKGVWNASSGKFSAATGGGFLVDAVSWLADRIRGLIADVATPAVHAALALLEGMIGQFGPVAKIPIGAARKLGDVVLNWIRGVDEGAKKTKAEREAALAVAAGGAGATGLNPELLERFNYWNVLGPAHGSMRIISGFRSNAQQQVLYAAYLAGTGNLAAKPGSSNHERGLAIDHSGPGGSSATWGYAATSTPYGLHHPVGGEPWHVEMFDRGGLLKPGLSLAWNGTGQYERVMTPGQSQRRGARGGVQIVQNVYPAEGMSEERLAAIASRRMAEAVRRG